jgi:hypothetical protein
MFMSGTAEDIKKHYKGLSDKCSFEVKPPYAIMASIGRRYLREKRAKEAVKIFEYYITVITKE